MSTVTVPLTEEEENLFRQYAIQSNLSVEEAVGETLRKLIPHLQFLLNTPPPAINPLQPAVNGASDDERDQTGAVAINPDYPRMKSAFLDKKALEHAIEISEHERNQPTMPADTDSSGLDQELAHYERNREILLKTYADQFVVIKGTDLVAVFPEQFDALEFGTAHFGNVAFLVRQITAQEKVVVIA